MTAPSPPAADGFEAQGFEALAGSLLAIPIETFDVRAVAFDRVVHALQDLTGRLRALVADVQEDLRGEAGDAFGEAGARLGGDIAAVTAAITGDAAALYRAGDAVAGAQRAVRDLAVERSRILAATPSPQVAGQFDELARRVANGLAQTYVQVGTGLPAIPGAFPGGTGSREPISAVSEGEPGVVRAAEPGEVPGAPTDEGAPLRAEHAVAPPVGVLVPAGPVAPGSESQRVDRRAFAAAPPDVRPAGGLAEAVQPGAAPVLGRVAAQIGTRPTSTEDVLPPAVLRSAATLEPAVQPPASNRPGHAVDGVRTQWQPAALGRPALGREQATSTTDVPALPVAPANLAPAVPVTATAAVGAGRGQQAPGRQTSQNPGSRRPSAGRDELGEDVSVAAESSPARAIPVEAPARPPERSTPVVPPATAPTPAEVPAPGSRLSPERSRAWAQEDSPAPVAQFATSSPTVPVTPPQPTNPTQFPGPTADPAGPGAPMAPPMFGPMGGMGGLTGRVEDERTRDVVLQEEPGAWDEGGGAPAVLGRR